jgi:DIM1 family U5 snRNP protein
MAMLMSSHWSMHVWRSGWKARGSARQGSMAGLQPCRRAFQRFLQLFHKNDFLRQIFTPNFTFDQVLLFSYAVQSTRRPQRQHQPTLTRSNTPPKPKSPRRDFTMGSVVLPHLRTGWHVDQAILSEEDRLVVIRFGRDSDPDCMRQDEVLYKIADRVKNFAALYVCDLDEVPDFKAMYELYDPCTVMFFFRNKHMMCDFGTGNNNKLNWVLEDKQELIDIIETVYRGAKKGRGLVVSPKDYSTRYRY